MRVGGLLLLGSLCSTVASAQEIHGVVRDSLSSEPVPAVRVELSGAGTARVVVTDATGAFRVAGLPGGAYRLRFARVGYGVRVLDAVQPSDAPLDVTLAPVGAPLDPVVISATRREQAALDAPAAVTVLDRAAIREGPALEPLSQVARVPGVNAARKGLLQQTFSARGANTVNSGALLLLHDYRYAALPSIAFNVPYLVPVTLDDVERIEVVRGPAAALYGPGAPAGIVHVLTRSPLDEPGGSATLTGGTRTVGGVALRYAARVSGTVGLRMSGEYLRGDDWGYVDPRESANLEAALTQGADADTLLIGARDSTVERVLADARLDWRPAIGTEVTVAAGATQALRVIDLTPAVGAIQGRDWRYSYAQVRARRGRLAVNALYNWSNAGDTYRLRTGDRLVDDSRVLVGQVQYGSFLGPVGLLYGADVRWTDPRTGRTIHGLNEDDDLVAELGGYLHLDLPLASRVRLVGAVRVDHHNRLNDVVWSPRVGVVLRPGATHAVRLTYNRAFTSPDANDLFLDLPVGVLGQPPIVITARGVGVPQGGFTFRRDCEGGLCMRSLFRPGVHLPVDATRLWPEAVAYAMSLGMDLSGVPPPTAAEVRTYLVTVDPLAEGLLPIPVDPADVADVPEEGRTITNVVELGYRGIIARRVELTVDLWVNHARNLPGPLVTATPLALVDSASLADYLSGHGIVPAEAERFAEALKGIPVGTVAPRESRYGADILVVTRRGGAYTQWGADVAATLELARGLAVSASYSWTRNDSIPDVRDVGTVYLNAPRSTGTAGASLTSPDGRLGVAAQARWVGTFRVNSGVYDGRVDEYVVVDASVRLPVPGWRRATLELLAQNLAGGRHREMIGAPEVGRLWLARLRVGL